LRSRDGTDTNRIWICSVD